MTVNLKKSISFETTYGIYTVDRIIGEGGAGRVYGGTDDEGKPIAIKLLSPDKATWEKVKRFKREMAFCEQNEHKNILTIIDRGVHQGKEKSLFYVMPLYSGSARDLMERKISPEKVLHYFSQILDGVEAAHLRKAIHRDLKPENILFDSPSDTLVVADFGIARFLEDEHYTFVETRSGARMANFEYAAPEQKKRGQSANEATDIYALGLILNEMFTGEIAQGTEYKTVASLANQYGYLDQIIAEMIRQNRDERPQTIEVVKNKLIAHKNEFVTRQKISELNAKKVVPVNQEEDPLITDPVRLIDAQWRDGQLLLELSQPVNNKWVFALQNMGSYSNAMGYEPQTFSIVHDNARIGVDANNVQRVIEYFKQWLPTATARYAYNMKMEKQEEQRRANEQLQRELAAKELELNVNKNLRI